MFRLLFELNRGVPNGTLRGVRGRRKSSLLDYELYMGKEKRHKINLVSLSAAGRGRTGTILLPQDFESCASANSATAAYEVKQFDFST